MRFFKFIANNNESITNDYDRIKYEIGKEIVVENVDMNKGNQCSNGIHCISMKVKPPIDCLNILFGPKVAILDAKKDDIAYSSRNGKCRLKRCKVINIYHVDDLPEKFKLKMGAIFYERLIYFLTTIKYNPKQLDLLKGTNFYVLDLYFRRLDKYYPGIEKYFVNKKLYECAVLYALNSKKYNNSILIKYLYNIGAKYEWAKIFPEDKEKVEETIRSSHEIYTYCLRMGYQKEEAEKFTEKISNCYFDMNSIRYILNIGTNNKLERQFLNRRNYGNISKTYRSFENILQYAVRYNKNTVKIRDSIKKYDKDAEKDIDYYRYKDFADEIVAKKDIKSIALSSSKLAFKYALLKGEVTEEIKNKIKESQYYILEYFKYVSLDKDMYSFIMKLNILLISFVILGCQTILLKLY
jgi:hypothetical protein